MRLAPQLFRPSLLLFLGRNLFLRRLALEVFGAFLLRGLFPALGLVVADGVELLQQRVDLLFVGFHDHGPPLIECGLALLGKLLGLGSKRKRRLDLLGDLERVEMSGGSLDRLVEGIALDIEGHPALATEFSSEAHPLPTLVGCQQEVGDRVVERLGTDRNPSTEEDNVYKRKGGVALARVACLPR